jgi:hypothetical protein
MLTCNYCGHTGDDVHDYGSGKPVCADFEACDRRITEATKDKIKQTGTGSKPQSRGGLHPC